MSETKAQWEDDFGTRWPTREVNGNVQLIDAFTLNRLEVKAALAGEMLPFLQNIVEGDTVQGLDYMAEAKEVRARYDALDAPAPEVK